MHARHDASRLKVPAHTCSLESTDGGLSQPQHSPWQPGVPSYRHLLNPAGRQLHVPKCHQGFFLQIPTAPLAKTMVLTFPPACTHSLTCSRMLEASNCAFWMDCFEVILFSLMQTYLVPKLIKHSRKSLRSAESCVRSLAFHLALNWPSPGLLSPHPARDAHWAASFSAGALANRLW